MLSDLANFWEFATKRMFTAHNSCFFVLELHLGCRIVRIHFRSDL